MKMSAFSGEEKAAGTIDVPQRPIKEYVVARRDQHIKNLDCLRDWAAFAVVICHIAYITLDPTQEGANASMIHRTIYALGAPAVDLFMALSGYVVTLSWMRQKTRSGTAQIFYGGRMLRLLPVYLASFGIALISWGISQNIGSQDSYALSLHERNLGIQDIIASVLPVWRIEATDILNPAWWTLQVEFAAMLLTPAIVAILMTSKKGVTIRAIMLIFFIIGLRLFLGLFGMPGVGQLSYLGTIIMGCLIAVHEIQRKNTERLFATHGLLVVGIIIMIAAQPLRHSDEIIPIMDIVSGFGAAIVIAMLRRPDALSIPSIGPRRLAGAISYPLYAIHLPLLALGATIAGAQYGATYSILMTGAILGAMLAVIMAIALYKTLEKNAMKTSSGYVTRRLSSLKNI